MTVPVATMVDTIHANYTEIPTDPNVVKYVAGYTSGTTSSPDIRWDGTAWTHFPNQTHVRIFQGYGGVSDVKSFDVIDVETYDTPNGPTWTVTPEFTAELVQARVRAGVEWTTVYCTEANLALVIDAIKKLGGSTLFDGHLNLVLADWNLNETEAVAKLGTAVNGVTCVGVQWASPSSNPNTLLPGTNRTLAESNCDLNVVDANWTPSGGFNPPAPAPVPQPVPQPVPHPVLPEHGYLVTAPAGTLTGRAVTSTDGGKTWQ